MLLVTISQLFREKYLKTVQSFLANGQKSDGTKYSQRNRQHHSGVSLLFPFPRPFGDLENRQGSYPESGCRGPLASNVEQQGRCGYQKPSRKMCNLKQNGWQPPVGSSRDTVAPIDAMWSRLALRRLRRAPMNLQ